MQATLNNLKQKVYLKKFYILFYKALNDGKITDFEEELFERMRNTFIGCLPVSLYIKYSNLLFAPGTCYDRSLYMFLALDNALYVYGDNKDLEYNYGKKNMEHCWIEIGDFVYDPSLMRKFDKETYYALYGCRNVVRIDKETYLQKNKAFVNRYVSHDINEFRPNGKRRMELGSLIILIRALSQRFGDENFNKEFNDYLALIEYNEKQIYAEKQGVIERALTGKTSSSIVSENR